jgi:hypothetical protein
MARIVWVMMTRGRPTGHSRLPSEPTMLIRFKGKAEMVIGRTEEWTNPLIPVADQGGAVVWMPLADPIWARGHVSSLMAGHMNAFEPSPRAGKARFNPG